MRNKWTNSYVEQKQCSAEKPDILLYLPTTVGYEHQGIPVDKYDISVATEIIGITQLPLYRNIDIFDLLECYGYLNNLAVGSSAESALDICVKLIGFLHDDEFVGLLFIQYENVILSVLSNHQNIGCRRL